MIVSRKGKYIIESSTLYYTIDKRPLSTAFRDIFKIRLAILNTLTFQKRIFNRNSKIKKKK